MSMETFQTRAMVLREARGSFNLEPVVLGPLRDDEVQVRVQACGICHTDILAATQKLPFPLPAVLGHEGAGIVEMVGARTAGIKPGDRVVLSFCSCGACHNCMDGASAYCRHKRALNFSGRRLDGSTPVHTFSCEEVNACFFGQSSFAEHVVVSARNVVVIPDDIPFEIAAPMGCGFQTGAGAMLNALKPVPGEAVAVFGVGAVGLAAIMAAHASGAGPIFAIDRDSHRLEMALAVGATDIVDIGVVSDVVQHLRDQTAGEGVHVSLECVGSAAVMRTAFECLRQKGRCGVTGGAVEDVTLPSLDLLYGRSIRGIVQGDSNPTTFIPRLIELWRSGRFPVEKLIQSFPFSTFNDAIAAASSGTVIKPVVRMSGYADDLTENTTITRQ